METLGYVHPTKKKIEEDSYQYISLLSTLEQYFLHDDVRKAVFHFPNVHQSDSQNLLSSYADGRYFQHHKFFQENSNFLQIHLYCNELEICNPLGTSKGKNKLTCFYFVLGNIRNRHISSLRNIFLTLIAKSSTIKQYGFLVVLAPLIADIKLLERNGLSIDIEGQIKKNFWNYWYSFC